MPTTVKLRTINRFFNITLGALAMLAVALLSAFIAMRLAIHGREAEVPNLSGLSIADASRKASSLGLRLTLENRFYSPATPPGRVLAQYPAPGATVRRQWAVRVTVSLGPQQVTIPNLIGQTERPAAINLHRLNLDLGVTAHIAAPGQPGIVLAQTPNPNASNIDRPRVSLLLSGTDDTDTPSPTPTSQAIVMPTLTGLTLTTAAARAANHGLHIVSAEDILTSPAATTAATPIPTNIGTVLTQTPAAGHRVLPGDPVHITISH